MPYDSKEKQAVAARKYYLANRQTMIDRAKDFKKNMVQELRSYIQELKSTTVCADCRNNYPYYVMQFDHVYGVKQFNIADTAKWTSKQRVLLEIEKCELVCANCHAERTYSRVDWS